MNKKVIALIVLIIVAGACLRCAGLNRPLLGNFYARQIEDAMIAKNYIRNGFNILEPAINVIVNGKPGLLLSNLHIYSYLVAIISNLFSLNMDFSGRLLSVIFSMFCGLYLYKLTIYFFDTNTAAIALFAYMFSPLSIIYGQSFQSETMGLFLFVFSIYYFIRYLDRRSFILFFLVSVSGALVFLLKIPWLVLSLLFVWICILKCRIIKIPFLKRLDVIFLSALILIPALAWILYVYGARSGPYVFISIFDEVASGRVILKGSYFTDIEFYKTVFGYLIKLLLNPIGFILFLTGIFIVKEKFLKKLLGGWLMITLLYSVAIPKKIFEQNYYLFPMVLVAVIYAAYGANAFIEYLSAKTGKRYKWYLLFLSLAFIFASLRYSIAPSFITPDEFKYAVYAGGEVSKNTRPQDLVVASSGGKSYLLYYSDRFGWNFNASVDKGSASKIEELESLRKKGASYLAIDYPAINFKNKDLRQYLYQRHKPVIDNEKLLLFDIRGKRGQL